MRRKNNEINVFSMSALDLFASALGAFILLAVIFLPFFPNTGDHPSISEEIRQRLAQAEADLADAQAENASLQSQLAQSQRQLAEAGKRKSILGIETDAERIAILVDMSGSMNGDQGDFRGLMVESVTKILDGLNETDAIQLIGFHAPGNSILLPAYPASGPVAVSTIRADALRELEGWMQQVDGGTPTLPAIEKAFEMNPEAIIVMTDGAPTVPSVDTADVLGRVNALNSAGVEIHAVAIGPFYSQPEFTRFLGRLTRENNGMLAAAVP